MSTNQTKLRMVSDLGDIAPVLSGISPEHMCALLDPAAYEIVSGDTTQTVPADTTWYVLQAWQCTFDGAPLYIRRMSIDNCFPCIEGTEIDLYSAGSHAYICKPELVTAPDDPYDTISRRLNLLNTMPLYSLTSSDAGGGSAGSWATVVNFPTDFSTGFARRTSVNDAAYLIAVGPTVQGMNLLDEISDTHPVRFTGITMFPFNRGTGAKLDGVISAKASWSGASIAHDCVLVYHKLDGTGW